MADPIQEGDTVRVIKDCCGAYLGQYHVVLDVMPVNRGVADSIWCPLCGDYNASGDELIARVSYNPNPYEEDFFPLRFLKKVPPLAEEEPQQMAEELTA